jgi:RNA polymerase sigma-54 factor
MESVEEIMGLEPKPGRRFGGSDSRYIVPDVVVHKMGGEYVVVLNEDGIPRLRVNSLYRSLLRTNGSEARRYVEQKLRSAVWLIKSVDQRQRTLRKVTQSIVKFQRDFLDKGLPYLGRCRCAMSARTSACTSPRSAASPRTSTWRRRRASSS